LKNTIKYFFVLLLYMMRATQDTEYESYYGIQLLDDLHNYFPQILYNHTRFLNVSDVLTYIQDIMHERFNLFSAATARFRQSHQQTLRQTAQQQQQQQQQQQYFYTIPTSGFTAADLGASHIQFAPIRIPYAASRAQPPTPPTDSEEERTPAVTQPRVQQQPQRNVSAISILSQILDPNVGVSDIISTLVGGSISEFAEPVVVAPTRHQIAAATRRYMAQTTLDTPCTICQDTILINSEVRKIDVCQHVFHKDCIDRWFRMNTKCPVCRHDIRDPVRQPAQTAQTAQPAATAATPATQVD
jgi:hypothetical protein